MFIEKKLTWRIHITKIALINTQKVEVINKKEFAKVALNKNLETFVVYIIIPEATKITIYPSKEAQITRYNLI